jgi:hypothetical protein
MGVSAVVVLVVAVTLASVLLYWMLSWWGSRPAKGRRVCDIVRRLEDKDDQL